MKKLLALLVAITAFSLLPSVSQAACVATGTIPRVFVVVGGVTNIGVRANGAPATFFNFTTTNATVIDTALIAEASHITVTIVGSAAVCGAVVGGQGGVSAGGTVTQILVSP